MVWHMVHPGKMFKAWKGSGYPPSLSILIDPAVKVFPLLVSISGK